MIAPDEGHGFTGREYRLAAFAVLEKFFAKQLGGRQHEAVPADIQTRIDALMVDVKGVMLQ